MLCVAEMLCVENNFVYVFCLMTFLFDDWMHALMTEEGGASSGSRVRIICKWVAEQYVYLPTIGHALAMLAMLQIRQFGGRARVFSTR